MSDDGYNSHAHIGTCGNTTPINVGDIDFGPVKFGHINVLSDF
jgi:hypothetical protein